jgi:hypothetical protein
LTAPLRAFYGLVGTTTLLCGSVAGALPGCSSAGDAQPARADSGLVDADEPDTSTPPSPDAGADVSPVDTGSSADVDGGVRDARTGGDTGGEAAAPPTYDNPVLPEDFPDPFVLRDGATYYAFGTNSGSKNIQAAKSTDLANWTLLPDALPKLPSWAASNAGLTWAPSVLQRGSTYILYYVARYVAAGFQCISHAEAQKPDGPYVDSTSAPFVCQVSGAQSLCGSIDPSPFIDTDGTAYLVWKSDENAPACSNPPRLWSAPLAADGLSLAGSPAQLLVMDQTWQQPIIEGPSMTLQAGKYYLLSVHLQRGDGARAGGRRVLRGRRGRSLARLPRVDRTDHDVRGRRSALDAHRSHRRRRRRPVLLRSDHHAATLLTRPPRHHEP